MGKEIKIKAISLKEPWASLILNGKKTIETRVWKTNYRGKLLICASKSPKTDISGKAVAIVELVECRPMAKRDEKAACCEVYDGAYSWILKDIRPIVQFEVKGRLGLFDVALSSHPS